MATVTDEEVPDYLLWVALALVVVGVVVGLAGAGRFARIAVTGGVVLAVLYVTFALFRSLFE